MEDDSKKILVPAIVGVIIIIAVAIGASYAFFATGVENSTSNTTFNATIGKVGNVAISGGSTMTMDLLATDMKESSAGTTYYATESGKISSTSSSVPTNATITIATAEVTGDGTFDCTGSITIKGTGNMYTKFQTIPSTDRVAGDVVLTITPGAGSSAGTSTTYDFNTSTLDSTLFSTNGTNIAFSMNGLTSSTSTTYRIITAQFKVKNTSKNQTAMAGSNVNFETHIDSFECTVR